MRDTKVLESFKKHAEKKLKEMNIFKNLKKEVEHGANGTQQYVIKKVNFGSKTMSIKKHIPARKRSFMARMGGVLKKEKGQKNLSPAYWSIRSWR